MQTFPLSLLRSYFSTFNGLPKSCYYGIALSLIESIFIGIYYYLSIYFIDVLHISITTSGIIISCYGIGAIFGGILGGKLSDRISSANVQVISLLLQSFVYFALIWSHSIILLAFNVFVLGIASYSFITANHLWTLNFCNENERLKAINILSTTSNLSLGLSALIISEAIYFGFQTIFLIGSIVLFLLASISFIYQNRSISISNHSADQVTSPIFKSTRSSTKAIFNLALLNLFFIGLIVAQMSSTYAIYIKTSYPELGIRAVTFLFALNSFIVVFFETPLGEYIKKFNKISMMGLGGMLIGLGMFILAFSHSFAEALVACVIYTLGEIIFFCMAQLICYQNASPNKRGHNLGVYRMIYASSRILGPVLGGIIYTRFGGNIIWFFCGLIGLISLTSCNYYKKYD